MSDEDRWQEYKDGVAMGYIWPDGSYRKPDFDPPDDWVDRYHRLTHTCGDEPEEFCNACDIAEDAAAIRREDR